MKKQEICRRNNRIERFWWTLLIVGILLIPLISAYDFDNQLSYSGDKKTVTITNAYGLGADIAVIKLLTPIINYVGIGKDIRVMEFEVENLGGDYENALKQMDIYNRQGKKKDKDYHYEYYDKNKWKKLNSKKLPTGITRVALVTDVYVGDYYDGIPTLFGVEISEWAVWTSALNTGLIAYYNFENETATSTNLVDQVRGKHNGTLTAGDNTGWRAGLIGEGYLCSGNDEFQISDHADFDDINLTVSFWAYAHLNNDWRLLEKWTGAGDRFDIYSTSADGGKWWSFVKAVSTTSNNVVSLNNWHHVVLVYNGTKSAMYIDGVIQTDVESQVGTFSNAANIFICSEHTGGENGFDGYVDELGIWNRSLNVTDIEDLYNAGAGISYVTGAGILLATTTLQSPTSGATYINGTTVQFNATISVAAGNVTNATLYIWDSSQSIINKTSVNINGTTNISSINVSMGSTGTNIWNVFGCGINDITYNCTWGTNRTIEITGFTENAKTNNATTYETARETFIIDLSYIEDSYDSISTNLVYNNVSYIGTPIGSIMDATFEYWLGTGTIMKNYSLDSSSNVNSYAFGLNVNRTLYTNSIIHLESEGYNERTYYFDEIVYNNITTNETLYLLEGGTNVIIQVRDSGLVPLQGYYVNIYRFYPENNTYNIMERLETDEYGQSVARLVENTVKYQFEFLDGNGVVRKRTADMTIACRATICVLPFVIEDTTDDTERFDNLTDYDWTFTFNNDTTTFTFTWNDVSGSSATNWLHVERYLFNGTTIICNKTSNASSGTLICNVGSTEASYQAQVFRKVGGENWRRIALLSEKVGTTYATYGNEGLIWSFFLLMTFIAIGYWNPPVGVAIFLGGNILLYATKIVYVNPAIFIAELLIGVLFIWAFGGRK